MNATGICSSIFLVNGSFEDPIIKYWVLIHFDHVELSRLLVCVWILSPATHSNVTMLSSSTTPLTYYSRLASNRTSWFLFNQGRTLRTMTDTNQAGRDQEKQKQEEIIKSKADDACIFCKIIKGAIPSFKIFENSTALAFFDINPISSGHALIIPKCNFFFLQASLILITFIRKQFSWCLLDFLLVGHGAKLHQLPDLWVHVHGSLTYCSIGNLWPTFIYYLRALSKSNLAKKSLLSALQDVLPIAKKIAIELGLTDYNILQNKLSHLHLNKAFCVNLLPPSAEQVFFFFSLAN